jgi:hypothetical protein
MSYDFNGQWQRVMAGLVPAIHVLLGRQIQPWMPGTGLHPGRPNAGPGRLGMTVEGSKSR